MCQPQLQHPPPLVSDHIITTIITHMAPCLVTPACAPLSVESIGLKSIPSADGEYSAKNSKLKKGFEHGTDDRSYFVYYNHLIRDKPIHEYDVLFPPACSDLVQISTSPPPPLYCPGDATCSMTLMLSYCGHCTAPTIWSPLSTRDQSIRPNIILHHHACLVTKQKTPEFILNI